jgi:tetratricopeptide (TPR) repeat protein/CHAT domain-containing protein
MEYEKRLLLRGKEIMDSENDFLSQGVERLQAGEYEAALIFLDQAIVQNPQQADAWYQKGLVLQKLGRYVEAVKANQTFLAAIDVWKTVNTTPENLNGTPLFEISQQTNLTEEWCELGNQQILSSDFEGAVASYDRSLESNPDHLQALCNRGIALFECNRYEDAIVSFDKALKINPNSHEIWNNWGSALLKLNRYEEAISSYDKALEIRPDLHGAWIRRGVALLNLNRYEDAIISFDKALKINPNDHEAWHGRGDALLNLNRYEDAIISFDKALKINSNDYEAWHKRGVALHYLNNYGEAIISFDRALAINPNDHNVWNVRGVSLSHFNRCEEAISSFDQALKITPDDYQSWFNRGITLCDYLARYEEAITSFDEALKFKPDYYEAWYNRGVSLSHLSLYEEAIASYDKALELNPSFHNAWYNRGIAVFFSPVYSRLPASVVGAILSQHNPQLNQRGYPGQVITLEFGLTQVTHLSEGWGGLYLGLGEAHFEQGKLEQQLGHNPSLYWQKTRHCLDLALSVLSDEAFPELRLEALQLMTRVLWVQGDNSTAQTYLKASSKLLHTLLNQAPTIPQKQQLEEKFSGVSQIAVDVWLQAGEPITALETAERFKNRCLTWILDAWKETVIYPSYADMQTLCTPDTAIIYWHLSSDNLSTFLLVDKTNAPGILESNKTSQARPNSLSTFLITDKENVPDILDFNRTSQARQLTAWMHEWNKHYRDYASQKFTGTEGENHPWRENLVSLLDDLRQKILQIDTICQKIPDTVQNLILIPHRDLHLLPLHHLFHDRCCTYLPSGQIGLNLRERATENKTYIPLLSVEDPATEQPPMPFAQLESAIIRHLAKSATCVKSNDATTDNVLKRVQKSFATFHFTGHGAYNSRNPADSALALTDGLLTAKDISQLDLSSYKLIVLAACETALTGNDGIKTEYVGLSSAFLKAGAANVLSTLWPVDEISSTWLTIRFYQFLLTGNAPRIALNRAQTWLKTVTWQQLADWIIQLSQLPGLNQGHVDLLTPRAKNTLKEGTIMGLNQPTKYSHPYYWAAFTLTGRG